MYLSKIFSSYLVDQFCFRSNKITFQSSRFDHFLIVLDEASYRCNLLRIFMEWITSKYTTKEIQNIETVYTDLWSIKKLIDNRAEENYNNLKNSDLEAYQMMIRFIHRSTLNIMNITAQKYLYDNTYTGPQRKDLYIDKEKSIEFRDSNIFEYETVRLSWKDVDIDHIMEHIESKKFKICEEYLHRRANTEIWKRGCCPFEGGIKLTKKFFRTKR